MRFRPCIDIHNGKVKQIVGSSLRDEGDRAKENYVAELGAEAFAGMFRRDGLTGGHVILLNSKDSPFYEETRAEARAALRAYPGGLQVGGGITAETAAGWIEAGASHVIVTSYVFREGRIDFGHLDALVRAVGREHVVLDLSCRKKPDGGSAANPDEEPDEAYYVCTDRWQHFTETKVDTKMLRSLAGQCDEFLVHGIAVEGKGSGIDEDLVSLLADFVSAEEVKALNGGKGFPVTYAGGIRSLGDIERLRTLGGGLVDYTVGSALDLYGGRLAYACLI